MKTIFLLSILLLSSTIFAQTATYQDVISNKKGNYKEYIANNGISFKVGDSITLGIPFRNEAYDYIFQTDPMGVQVYPLESRATNSKVMIKKIQIMSRTTRIIATKPNGHALNIVIINLDEAIKQGEIKSSLLTSEQAIEKLKIEKEKLDLQIINQRQYDSIKVELMKYIK